MKSVKYKKKKKLKQLNILAQTMHAMWRYLVFYHFNIRINIKTKVYFQDFSTDGLIVEAGFQCFRKFNLLFNNNDKMQEWPDYGKSLS